MAKVAFEHLVRFAQEFLVAKGVPDDRARAVAETVVTTEAFGITTHGLSFLPYADVAIPGTIDPEAEPTVASDRGATAVIAGGRCFAQLAMRRAADIALRKAAALGISMVSVKDTGWLAALGVQLLPIAERGMLAQVWAQTNTCKDCAPVGGIEARFSTNPLALAIPTDGDPIVADFSTTAVSMGKAKAMAGRGEKAPERIFMDREGKLSDDPRVVKEGGTILFTGGEHHGHKGYGLSLWCEALTAAGGGECNNPLSRTQQNFTLQVIDPAMLGGRDHYLAEIARFARHVKTSRPRPGVASIRLPGERGFAALSRARAEGVDVEEAMLAKLDDLAAKTGIASARGR
jgi:LDH2 family malate/lactate/ureidoglycolate dehydrogenase